MSEDNNSRLSRTSEEISLPSLRSSKTAIASNTSESIEDGQVSSGSNEDDINQQCTSANMYKSSNDFNRDPMFVIVDSSCVSNPSSTEILINKINVPKEVTVKKNLKNNVIPTDIPCTSKDPSDLLPIQIHNSESREELQVVDINLLSDNEIPITELSENSLDVRISSYPGSRQSFNVESVISLNSDAHEDTRIKEAIEFLHQDKDFLVAAEIGNDKLLEIYIRKGTDIQQVDHLGRNALHLAVCSGNLEAIKLLLDSGVNPKVKDNVGMSPLSLSLMRRPSLLVANLLFDHGAKLMPRSNPMDTGLFIQFAMMCTPSIEEQKILQLLVQKGAVINDTYAPGGRQALHFAAMSNNTTLIRILVKLGADLYMRNHRNETPKEMAATFKCRDAYELLLEFEEVEDLTISSSSSVFKNLT